MLDDFNKNKRAKNLIKQELGRVPATATAFFTLCKPAVKIHASPLSQETRVACMCRNIFMKTTAQTTLSAIHWATSAAIILYFKRPLILHKR